MTHLVGKPGKGSLWHTKDGDLDFGWLILIACCVVGLAAFILSGFGLFKASVAAWSWFGSFTTFAFIAGAAIGRARLIAKSPVAGAVAQGIATSPAELLPNIRKDDERHGGIE